jgi:SNF2 family DNA or RNA helicase
MDQRKVATEFLVNNAKKFTVCILDEVHIVKNGEPSERHKDGYLEHGENHQTFNVQEITQNIPFVWGASSTIIANRPIDLLNQLKAINHPMGRMDYDDFIRYFDDRSNEHEQMRKADLIRDLLTDQGVYLRRSKKEVNPSIPNVNINEEAISLTSSERSNVMAGITGRPTFKDITKIRARIAASKIEMTIEKAIDIISKGKKVAIFTAYPGTTLKPIQEQLEMLLLSIDPSGKKKVASIVGGDSKEKRSQTIEEIKDPSSDIVAIVISIDAGGTGLDFPNILTDVIVNDFDWTPSDDEQSLGRFHRISSKEPINVTYMVAHNTLDQKYFKLLQEKKEIAERIQNLSNQEKEAISSGRSNVSEEILRLRKQRYEEQMKLSNIDKALKS